MNETINPKVWDNDIWLKHIHLNGSVYHVTFWTNKGSFCKEKNCIHNAPPEVKERASLEGLKTEIFIAGDVRGDLFDVYLSLPVYLNESNEGIDKFNILW